MRSIYFALKSLLYELIADSFMNILRSYHYKKFIPVNFLRSIYFAVKSLLYELIADLFMNILRGYHYKKFIPAAISAHNTR